VCNLRSHTAVTHGNCPLKPAEAFVSAFHAYYCPWHIHSTPRGGETRAPVLAAPVQSTASCYSHPLMHHCSVAWIHSCPLCSSFCTRPPSLVTCHSSLITPYTPGHEAGQAPQHPVHGEPAGGREAGPGHVWEGATRACSTWGRPGAVAQGCDITDSVTKVKISRGEAAECSALVKHLDIGRWQLWRHIAAAEQPR